MLNFIGRYKGSFEFLVLKQVKALRKELNLGLSVEKYILINSYRRYTKDLDGVIAQISELPPKKFFNEMREYSHLLEDFIKDFHTDITIFPEYAQSVLDAVRETGKYHAELIHL